VTPLLIQAVTGSGRARFSLSRPLQVTLRLSCFGKRQALRDDWFDFLLLKEIKQGGQILPKRDGLKRFNRCF
jgi:hypothetical protein